MRELGREGVRAVSLVRPEAGFAGVERRAGRAKGHLCRALRSHYAILVDQGSDPTLPYQALVIRQSATLFEGFAPWGHSGVVRPQAWPG